MCACLTTDQNPLALSRFGSSESGGPFQLTGLFARSHRNVSWCADRGSAQNFSEFRLVLTPSVAVVMGLYLNSRWSEPAKIRGPDRQDAKPAYVAAHRLMGSKMLPLSRYVPAHYPGRNMRNTTSGRCASCSAPTAWLLIDRDAGSDVPVRWPYRHETEAP